MFPAAPTTLISGADSPHITKSGRNKNQGCVSGTLTESGVEECTKQTSGGLRSGPSKTEQTTCVAQRLRPSPCSLERLKAFRFLGKGGGNPAEVEGHVLPMRKKPRTTSDAAHRQTGSGSRREEAQECKRSKALQHKISTGMHDDIFSLSSFELDLEDFTSHFEMSGEQDNSPISNNLCATSSSTVFNTPVGAPKFNPLCQSTVDTQKSRQGISVASTSLSQQFQSSFATAQRPHTQSTVACSPQSADMPTPTLSSQCFRTPQMMLTTSFRGSASKLCAGNSTASSRGLTPTTISVRTPTSVLTTSCLPSKRKFPGPAGLLPSLVSK